MLVGSSVCISSVSCESADIGGSCILFQTTVTYLGVHLDQTLSMKQHISSLCRTTFLALRSITSIRPFLSNSSTEKLVASMITSRLDYCICYFRRSSRWTNRALTKDPEQRRTAHLEKIEAWSCHNVFERTQLAPSKILHSVQVRNARFPSLWRHSSAIPVFFSLHISTIALPSFFDRKTAQNSKNKPENLRWTFF